MNRLSNCFRKAGKAISSRDREAIENYVAEGMSEHGAVQAHINDLTSELDSIASYVEGQGGAVNRDAVKAEVETGGRPTGYLPESQVQLASAGSRFIKEMLKLGDEATSMAGKAGKKILQQESNYAEFKDAEPVEGIDFNFENINTSDDVKNTINIISDQYKSHIGKAKKGEIPHSVTKNIALLLGGSEEDAVKAVKSLPGDVEDLHVRALTMRNMLVKSAEKMDDLARVIKDGGPDVSDADYLRFREHLVMHAQLQAQMKGVQTEIARALSAFRIPAESIERNPNLANEVLDKLGGRETAMEIADRWLTTPIYNRPEFAERSFMAKSKDAVYEIWINGLLSGLRTDQVNVLGNLLFTMFQVPERFGAAAIGAVTRSPDRVRFQEVFAQARGASEGFVDGIRLAWKAWKDEMPTDGIAKMEAQKLKAITPENFNVDPNSIHGKAIDYVGQGVRLPGRMLLAEDEFFKSVGYRMELRALTTRKLLQARDEGTLDDLIVDTSNVAVKSDQSVLTELRKVAQDRRLTAEELGQLYELMLRNPTGEVDIASHDFATMITFQTELGMAGKAMQHAASRIPGGRVILPFIRTPTNIVKEFSRRSPLSLAMPSVHKDIMAGGARRDLALAKIGMGTSLMTWAAFLAQDGIITGGGPKDPKLRAAWMETNRPYSMKIGDKWVPYGRMEPLAMLFGSVADAVDFIQYSDNDESNQAVYTAAFVGVMKNIGDKTFLRGISDFTDAYSNPERYGEQYISGLASTVMPFSSMVRDIARADDPVLRETRPNPTDEPINMGLDRILNEFKARVPGFSKDLPPKRTFWGEERRAYEGGPATAFFAFAPWKIKRSPIDEELVRLNQPLTMPRRSIGKMELTFQQYDRLVVLMNSNPSDMMNPDLAVKYGDKKMRAAMNNLVKSPIWEALDSDEVKAEYLKSIKNDYLEAAKKALSFEDNDVSDALLDEQAEGMMLEGQRGLLRQLGPLNTQIEAPTTGTGQ